MDSNEFYQEVTNSDICPDHFDEIFTEFKEYQKLANKTLEAFSRVCKMNNIMYQLAFGTLLGAVRDGGQIPWDYDIDVYIRYDDRNRLKGALDADLGGDYYYTCPENNAKCTQTFIRVAPKGVDSEALHVDVFYLIGMTDDDSARLIIQERLLDIIWDRYYKNVKLRDELYKGIKRVLALIKLKYLRRAISNDAEIQEYFDLCDKYDIDETEWIVDATMTTQKTKFKKDMLLDMIEWESDFGVHYIPRDYDSVLKVLYKNYTEYLPLENRISEMMNSYKKLHGLCKKK